MLWQSAKGAIAFQFMVLRLARDFAIRSVVAWMPFDPRSPFDKHSAGHCDGSHL